MNLQTIDKRDYLTSVNIRKRKIFITQPLLMKSENFMLISLEVQSTFFLVVTSCGINTVLSLLKNFDFPTLLQENIYQLKQVLIVLSGSVSLVINI